MRAMIYFDYGTADDETFVAILEMLISDYRKGQAKLTDFMIEVDYEHPLVATLDEMELMQDAAKVGVGD